MGDKMNLNRILKMLDGSGREARPLQQQVLSDIVDWNRKTRILAIDAGTGTGKTLLIRTLQRYLKAPIITSSNYELKKYVKEYKLTSLMGIKHYQDKDHYLAHRRFANDQSVYNYMSYLYSGQKHDTVIIDEAHNLEDTLVRMSSITLPLGYDDYMYLNGDNLKIIETLSTKLDILVNRSKQSAERWKKYIDFIERLYFVVEELKANSHKYLLRIIRTYVKGHMRFDLVMTPCVPPYHLLSRLTRAKNIILFSGTITKQYLQTIIPEQELTYYHYDSQAPRDSRPIYYYPNVSKHNAHRETVAKIQQICKLGNTFVHSTYKDLPIYKNLYPSVICTTSNSFSVKQSTVDEFRQHGGVMIAAGMYEGVDLPGDQCRNIVIPSIHYLNLGEEYVKKRMTLPDGKIWYQERALMMLRQQLGRGHRGPDDFCRTWVFCPTLARLIQRTKPSLDFLQSIEWSSGAIQGVLNDIKV